MYRTYENGGYEAAHRDYGEGLVQTDDLGLFPAESWERADREPFRIEAAVGVGHPLDGHPLSETFDVPRTYAPILVHQLGLRGLGELHGMTGRTTLRTLSAAVEALGTTVYGGAYHVPVGRPPEDLDLALARECGMDPEAPENEKFLRRALDTGAAREARASDKPTPGNVGALLAVLRGWATEHPNGVWNVGWRPDAMWNERGASHAT